MPGMVEAMKTMKDASLALLSDQQAKLSSPYFDFLIQGMQTSTWHNNIKGTQKETGLKWPGFLLQI